MNLLTLLSDRGVLERGRVPEIEVELAKPEAKPEEVLQKAGIALQNILKAKGEYYGIPTREVGETAVPFDILRFIPEESARHYKLAPLGEAEGALEGGITDPVFASLTDFGVTIPPQNAGRRNPFAPVGK